MKRILTLAMLMLAAISTAQAAEKYPQRWNYVGASLNNDAGLTKFIDVLKQSKEVGCTHILMPEGGWYNTPDNPAYLARVAKAKAAAKELNLTLIPCVYSLGYSGRYLGADPNLAAGLPVKQVPFVVAGKTAQVDPSLAIDCSAVKPNEDGNIDVELKARPYTHYSIRFTLTKGQYKGDADEMLRISTCKKSDGWKRWVTRTHPISYKEGNKFIAQTTFNTLELDDGVMRLQIMAPCADIKIEPIGAMNMVRRELTPLVVTSEDGKTVYAEGKDYKPFHDPNLMTAPDWTDQPTPGAAPKLLGPAMELTDNSSIKNGQKLLLSYFHAYRIYGDQDEISMEDPKVFDLMERDAANCVKVWGAPGYFMNYDEIRICGWEPTPSGKPMTPGEILAEHVKKGYDLLKKHAPQATIYTWSDMFSPFENAYGPGQGKRYYYLVHDYWNGADKGLPTDTTIMIWAAQNSDDIKFFADRGQQQVLCGYYDTKTDAGMKQNITRGRQFSSGQKGILGFMYTTWGHDYARLKPYFKLLDTADTWYKPTGSAQQKAEGMPQ